VSSKKNKSIFNDWRFVTILCVVIGLAPFYPEPHIWGKLKWIAGGAQGMKVEDFIDVAIHLAPFLLLIRIVYRKFRGNIEE